VKSYVRKDEEAITNVHLADAHVVLELLHGLPLALTQAGSYMRETNVSALTYAKHYNQTWGRLMKKQDRFPLEEYGNRSVLTTWTVSYEQVQRQSEAASWLLKLWGFLGSGELWYELIALGMDLARETDIPAWLHKIAEDEMEFVEAASLLCRYSLAETTADSGSYSMHAVLHRWCGQLAEGLERHKLCCMAAGLVAANVLSKEDVEYWKKRKRLLAHGISVSRWIEEEYMDSGEAKEVSVQPEQYYNLGYLLADEDKQRATKMYKRALEGYEKAWGPEHTETLGTVNNLGNLYTDLGKHKEAETMYKRALEGKEKVWGPEHTSTLDTVSNLGNLYADLGMLKKAENMYKRALEGFEKALGPEHTSTLDTINNLGLLYADLDKHKEAEKMYKRALEGKEKVWGPEHTSTLDTVSNLGILYKSLGEHKEAENMYKRALEGFEKAWGPEHTSTLDTIYNLGLLYAKLGKHKEAEKMFERALSGYKTAIESKMFPTYVPALNTMWALGSLSDSQGYVDEARAWYSKALLGYEKVLGANHPKCQPLCDRMTALERAENESTALVETASVQEQVYNEDVMEPSQPQPQAEPTSRWHKVMRKLGWKRA
jgi:tetratricopeptide (TPR) repeat protein